MSSLACVLKPRKRHIHRVLDHKALARGEDEASEFTKFGRTLDRQERDRLADSALYTAAYRAIMEDEDYDQVLALMNGPTEEARLLHWAISRFTPTTPKPPAEDAKGRVLQRMLQKCNTLQEKAI